MKISCPACSAKYSITDDKVQDRLAKIRCRKCGATIVIDGKTQPPNVYTSAGDGGESPDAPEPAATEYSVDFGEGDQRSLPLRELVAAYNGGQINGDTYVWAEGFTDWKPLGEVPEIVEALNAPAAPAPSPWDAKPAAAAASKKPVASASTVPRAAARTGGRTAASADLFSRIDSAGSEDDVATSAPEQPSPLATPSASSGTGARNESSVLFSLSALTSAAQNQTSSRPGANGAASRDDSGLIDLKALTAAAMKNAATGVPPSVAPAFAPIAAPPLGVAPPLGFGSPLGSPVNLASLDLGMPQQRSKAPLFIGGGLAVGLLAIAAAILLKPDPPPPPPAPVIVQAPPPPAPTPAPTPEAIAKPPATGTPEEDPKAATAAKKKWTGGAVKKPAGGGSTSSGSAPASDSKPAAKPRSACGCASGDLQCAMRCAAKGG